MSAIAESELCWTNAYKCTRILGNGGAPKYRDLKKENLALNKVIKLLR